VSSVSFLRMASGFSVRDSASELLSELSNAIFPMKLFCLWVVLCLSLLRNPNVRYDCSEERRNLHEGTLAKATSHFKTCWQKTNKQSPPIQITDFNISAWGERENNKRLISAISSSCNSAGRRLVVVRNSRVASRVWWRG
jgi:hypothetical protein